jgi:hypothetical protein
MYRFSRLRTSECVDVDEDDELDTVELVSEWSVAMEEKLFSMSAMVQCGRASV